MFRGHLGLPTVALHIATLPAKACEFAKHLVRQASQLLHKVAMLHERALTCDCLVDPASVERDGPSGFDRR